ncbi:haloalkane dehalogenase [Salinisphaera dokdonensis CL-ES53]|uniref:Haloalkane dehalogenase n=1 Tax=Salinisphaera dokdonensis CL-ES53 TaxID=1304272 RepID=A0ABV2AWK6_9GAMM
MSGEVMPYEKRHVTVNGRSMAYVESGTGDPIVFLHGNPTSSYLWRNIIPHAEAFGRCIAPDLIGMGDSEPRGSTGPDAYDFFEHRHYLDGLLDALGVTENVILVVHDWGSGLGFDWANRHRDRVQGIVYMEALVRPLAWSEWSASAKDIFATMRSAAGEEICLDKNVFVEKILPSSILRDLTDTEMAEYRRPFADAGEARRPTLSWPRQIPFDGEPAAVHDVMDGYGQWLASDESPPKLFINAEPGIVLIGEQREFCRTWPRQQEITVSGLHFVQEDSPAEIGAGIAAFVGELRGQEPG